MASSGQITPILRGSHGVWRGFVASGIQPNGEVPLPIGERYRFSHQDQRATLMVEWDAIKAIKCQASMALYDLDNRRVSTGKVVKLSAPAGHKAAAAWTLVPGGMPTGIYRVDVLADSDVVWRAYVRVEN